MNLKNKAISGIKWTSVEKVGKAVFQVLQIAILTRFLPKEAFGLIAIAVVVINFTNIFVDMGMTSAILFRQNATQREYSSIYWLNLFVSVGLVLLLLTITPLISSFYNEPELLYIIPMLSVNILLVALGRQHRTIMQKEFRFKPIAIIELTAYFVSLIIAVILAYAGNGVYSLVYSTLAAASISNGLFLSTNIRENPISFHFKLRETIPFLKVGGFQTGGKIFDFLSKEADIFIIGKLLGAEALGVFSLTKQLVFRLYQLINPIVISVLSPLLSSIQKEKRKLKVSFLKSIKYLSYINFPVYLLVIVLSEEILIILYGSEYSQGAKVLSFLAISFCIMALSNPVGSLQIATGRTDLGFYWTIFRVIFTPLFIYLGASYGIEGVSIAHAMLSILLLVPLWYFQLRPMASISIKEYFQQFYKPVLLFFTFTTISMLNLEIFNYRSHIVALVMKTTIFMSLFLSLMYLLDKDSFKKIMSINLKR